MLGTPSLQSLVFLKLPFIDKEVVLIFFIDILSSTYNK